MSRYKRKKYSIYTFIILFIVFSISFLFGYKFYINIFKKSNEDYALKETDNQIENNINNNQTTIVSAQLDKNYINDILENKVENNISENSDVKKNITENIHLKNNEEKVELNFIKPVEGEIINAFAKDTLIYSNTLKEWITHEGIDIVADKMTVVKSSEDGNIKSIKNDPRYGLTVVIEHKDGFITVYSNLLTAEYVSEGEEVVKGQTIGTIGNSAAFEIAEKPHLHFEIKQNGKSIDPSLYIITNE